MELSRCIGTLKILMLSEITFASKSFMTSQCKRQLIRHIFLQALGRDGIQTKVREAFESSELVWKKISKYPCLRLLVREKLI